MKIWSCLPIPENVLFTFCVIISLVRTVHVRDWSSTQVTKMRWIDEVEVTRFFHRRISRDRLLAWWSVCFSKVCSLCLGGGLRKLVVFSSGELQETDHNFILNLCTERLCKLWKNLNWSCKALFLWDIFAVVFESIPEIVNCFRQIASYQIGSVVSQF